MEQTTDNEIRKATRYTQTESGYMPLSETPNQACANCRFFSNDGGGYCIVCENYPLDILPTGWCNEWEALPAANGGTETGSSVESAVMDGISAGAASYEGKDDKREAQLAVRQEQYKEELTLLQEHFSKSLAEYQATTATDNPTPTIIQRVKQLFTSKPDSSPFQVFKAADGRHYWLARHTNNFEDRDNEILSQKAHEAYVARVNLGFVPPPELWAYHTKGTRHGQADQVWLHQNFVFALGHFDDTPEAQQAIKWYQSQKGNIELSHGFTFPKWALKDGVYETYNTFEITTLPPKSASNPYTAFEEIDTMALSEKQANWIKSTLGEAGLKRVQDAQSTAEKDADVLKAIDAKYKDFVETQPTESDKGGSAEVTKTLLADMIAVQAELVEQVEGFKAEIAAFKSAEETATKAHADTVTALAETVKALQAQLDARPKSASTAEETKIEKSALPEAVTSVNVELDPFWRVPVKGD